MESLLRREKDLIPDTCLRLIPVAEDDSPVADAAVSSSELAVSAVKDLPGCGVYPAVVGLTLREATALLVGAGIRWQAFGSGMVVKQDPAAKTRLTDNNVCRIWLD
jgi:hypothetical protein